MKHQLSKSKYCHGRICAKRLWLSIHKPELEKPLSDYDKWNIERGYEVEGVAQELFPSGIKIKQSLQDFEQYADNTQQALNGDAKAIFQGAFIANDILVICDILDKQNDGTYHLYEVKSFSDPKKKIKENDPTNFYINDLQIQVFILKSCGLEISRACTMFLNKKYQKGEKLEPNQLFDYYDLDINQLDDAAIKQQIQTLIKVKQSPDEPIREMGPQCAKPFECPLKDYCLGLLPSDSLRKTNIFHPSTRANLMKQGQDRISNLDLKNKKVIEKMPLIKAEQKNTIQTNKPELKEFLNSIKYPIYFLDFEAARFPIPRYDRQHPYELLPFQYSIHILEKANATPKHKKFLWTEDSDPSKACAESLCNDIGPIGSILMYSNYEEQVINHLIKQAPKFQTQLKDFIGRLVDLEYPFKNQICCIPKSMGYSSIKVIQPLLNPEFGYKGLNIQSGDIAMVKYWELIDAYSAADKEKIVSDLKAYCQQDTLAMLKAYEALKTLI